jgi:Flp pilus assembly protein TadG
MTALPQLRSRSLSVQPRDDRGAVAVEFALIVTVLIALTFGALDIGFKWRSSHEAVGASRAGARVAAGLGDDRTTDLNVLATVRASLDSVGMLGGLSRVIVYDSNTADGRPPTSCTAATPSGRCQVYPASSIASPPVDTNFNANGCMISGATYQGWCPNVRIVDQRTADYVGVMIVMNARSITGVFGDTVVRRHTTMRIEPTAQ